MWWRELLGWTPVWLWYLLAVSLLIYLWGIWPYFTTHITVPGPKPAPFFGTLLQYGRQGLLQSDLENLKKYGKVYVSWVGRRPVINVADPDMVKEICVRDFAKFNRRQIVMPLSPIQKSMISFMAGERWKFIRTVLTPAFSSAKIRQMVPLIDVCLKRMIENLSNFSTTNHSVDVKAVMDGLTMEVIGSVAFGIETDTQNDLNSQFIYYAKTLFEGSTITKVSVMISAICPCLLPVFEAVGLTTESKKYTEFVVNFLTEAIKQRRHEPSKRTDLLQSLLDNSVDHLEETLVDKDVDIDALRPTNAKGNKKLTDQEVIAQCTVFLFAGFETTASALTFLFYNLALYPECQAKLIEEIDETLKGAAPTYDNVMSLPYLDQCLSETQRLYPALRGSTRMSAEDVTVKGVYIPENTYVILQTFAIQHDATFWPDPERFDPERWSPEQKAANHPYAFLPFGVGPRNCIGMRMALLEAKMAAVSILQKFRFCRAPDTQIPVTFKKGTFIQPEKKIMLKVEPRY